MHPYWVHVMVPIVIILQRLSPCHIRGRWWKKWIIICTLLLCDWFPLRCQLYGQFEGCISICYRISHSGVSTVVSVVFLENVCVDPDGFIPSINRDCRSGGRNIQIIYQYNNVKILLSTSFLSRNTGVLPAKCREIIQSKSICSAVKWPLWLLYYFILYS